MAGPKFFVHGGLRWREIDTTSGSVSGWGNVEFLYVHRGRLQVARKNSVLRGLRSLAAGKPTSVHDGPQLSQIRLTNEIEEKKQDEYAKLQHHCCCRQQDLRYNTDVIFNNLLKAATSTASVQCSLAEVNTCIQPSPSKPIALSPKKHATANHQNQEKTLLAKRKHSTSDDEENLPRKNESTRNKKAESVSEQTKKAPLHSNNSTKYNKIKSGKSKTSRKLSSSDEVQETLPKLRKSLRLNQESPGTSGEGTHLTGPKERNVHTVNINKNDKLRKPARKVSTSDDEVPKKLTKSPRKNRDDVKSGTQLKERSTRNSLKSSTYVTPDENQVLRKPKRKLSVSDDEDIRKVSKTRHDLDTVTRQTQESENELCKELLIGEEDVLLLRTFIERDDANIFGVDLERFDSDDNYKGMIFYKLNPLVNIVRSKQISTMLRDKRRESNNVSLEDFISKLGLRSVLDSSSQSSSKYRMRPRHTKDQSQHTSESEFDKENYKKFKRDNSKTSHNKVLVESVRDIGNKKNRIISKKVKKAVGLKGKVTSKPQKSRKDSVEVVSLSSDSDSVFEKSKQSVQNKQANDEQRLMSTVVLKRVNKGGWMVSPGGRADERMGGQVDGRPGGRVDGRPGGRVSGRSGREYSVAEDEAVVSWVRGGGRARRVNGNQLWRELEPIHQQRTGHFRSWHSLRNRYLRYLLPSLGTLALPPHEAVRLRADAAAGEIKFRKKPQRRNSLPKQPIVRSAWSRRPRSPPRESSPSRSDSPLPSPFHSDSSSPPRTRTKSLPVRTSTSNSYSPTDSETSIMSKDKWKSKVNSVKMSSRQLRSSDVFPNKEKEISYSQLTRRFADKHSTPSSDVTSERHRDKRTHDRDHEKQRDDRPRTRRLYNPNAI